MRDARLLTAFTLCAALASLLGAQNAPAATYYVSSSSGNDSDDGLSPATAFQTIAKVNALALVGGDEVLFQCGDVWRAEILRVTRSGAAGNPITYGAYPDAACTNRPILDGSLPITGWALSSGSIYVADLTAGANAGRFPHGINQLFRDGQRLILGRWPNLGAGDESDGYSTIDAQSANDLTITDAALPAVNWKGATAHIKGMRWYILNRQVLTDSGNTLTLNAAAGCWGGSCVGWGFFLNGHLSTLDQDGEWFYDAATQRVYLYSTSGVPAAIEGSVVIAGESEYMGAVILGRHLQEHVAYVTLDNLELRRWFDNGVTTPVNLERDEHSNIRLRDLVIRDVDGTGIKLATWVWNAQANGNGYNGWRGGKNLEISGCVIERANEFGIDSYARLTSITGNTLTDIGQIRNVGRAGIGCSDEDGEGQCTEPGAGIRLKVDSNGLYSSNNVTVEGNRLERIGHNGLQALGYQNTLRRNVVREACTTKGDCGAISLFGSSPLSSSTVHDVTIQENVLLDTVGNTDGAHTTYRDLFGFGLYIDNYSRNITSTGNTIARATAAGILYQNSTGVVTGNTLWGNGSGSPWVPQVVLTDSATTNLTAFTDNVLVGLQPTAATLSVRNAAQVGTSNRNGFYHSSRTTHISAAGQDRTLAQWQSYSGKDAASREWVGAPIGLSQLFVNDSASTRTFALPGTWLGLDGSAVGPSLDLAPFTSRVLIASDVPVPSVADTSVVEGHAGTTPAVFAVTLSEPSDAVVTVDYATADGSALAGLDYVATSGTVTFPAGTTSQTVNVPILGDPGLEPNETFTLRLTGAAGAALFGGQGTGTILNDDPQPTLRFAAATLNVAENAGAATLTVLRGGASTVPVSVSYASAAGTAAAGQDYTSISGTLTFAAGETSRTLALPLVDNTLQEGSETVSVALASPGGGAALAAPTTVVVTIVDNDRGGTLAFGSAAVSASEGVGSATITVKRSGGIASGVTVDYATSNGTALAGADYTGVSGTLSFAAGQTAATFGVPITDDLLGEGNETVTLNLTNPTGGAVLGTARAVLTILENERVLQLERPNVSVTEGATASIVVRRSGLMAGSATVGYVVSDGTANAGADYPATSGTLTFGPGVALRSFALPTLNDTRVEDPETLLVGLTNPVDAVLGATQTSVVTVADNDRGGVLQLGQAAYSLAETGGPLTVLVTRSGGVASDVSVGYAVVAGTATAGSDFLAGSGTLTFAAGQIRQSFVVPVLDDGEAEGAETVALTLSSPTGGATLGARASATLTILDDESTLELAAPTFSVVEGALASVLVRRSGSLTAVATVEYGTADDTAVAPADYAARSGTLTFPVGVASRPIAVPTASDTVADGAKALRVTLANPVGAALGHQAGASVVINDNDLAGIVQLSAASYTASEGPASATIAVRRSGGTASGVTVHYATADGTATAGLDYTTASGTLTFNAGQGAASFVVPLLTDTEAEGSETVLLLLSAPGGGATLGAHSNGVLTILDKTAPTVQLSSAAYAVAESGRQATITVTRKGPLTAPATVQYATADGDVAAAVAGLDYTDASGTLSFAAGQASRTFVVPVTQDRLAEGPETVDLALSAPTGALLGTPVAGVLTLRDDDVAGVVQLSVPSWSVVEGESGVSRAVTITVVRTGGSASGVTVAYATSNNTASAGSDYTAAAGTLSFAEGQTSATFVVTVHGDGVLEGNEALTLTLSNPTGGARLGTTTSATLWIVEPAGAAKLVLVHDGTAGGWLADDGGQLGLLLRDNNYFVSDAGSSEGASEVEGLAGWTDGFLGAASESYREALLRESGQQIPYARLVDPDPARGNEVVLLEGRWSSAGLAGDPAAPPALDENPLLVGDVTPETLTVANTKGVYIQLLAPFGRHPETLFVVIVTPAAQAASAEGAANVRALNDWLVRGWLTGAPRNVAVISLADVLSVRPEESGVDAQRRAAQALVGALNQVYSRWLGRSGREVAAPPGRVAPPR